MVVYSVDRLFRNNSPPPACPGLLHRREGGYPLEIHVREKEKMIEVWLTGQEREKPEIKRRLEELYRLGKERRCLVVVFLSGREELGELTSALLLHNRDELARRKAARRAGA